MAQNNVVQSLDALTAADPEYSHIRADALVVGFLLKTEYKDVAQAFIKADERCGFWYA